MMEIPGADRIQSLAFHGGICITKQDWAAFKEKVEKDYLGDACAGCYLTLFVTDDGNLAIGCGRHGGGGPSSPADDPAVHPDCSLQITYVEGRGHRAHCGYDADD